MRKNILISLLTLLLLNVQLLASGVDWTVNVHNYQYDMTAYVTLRLNGADVADLSSYTIAAFCNDECRGVMEARSVDNNTYGYLRIRSNQFSGEIITFKVYDPVSDRIAISTNQITFQSQQVIGYPSSPFVVEAMFQNWEPEFITICYGDSFAWDKSGKTYTESGVYTTIYDNAQATLHLTVLPEVPTTTEYATICHGETYTWNGQTYSTEGEYSVTLSNTLGCDSVATLQLTIMPEAITSTETVVIGSDELPYVWRGNTYSATGRYTDIEQYATIACDSVIHVLDLTVLTTGNHDEQSVTICETEAPYTWYGESYSATGKYTYTEKYVGTDIDSIQHILNLTVNPTVYTEEHITACDSYTWNGQTYTESGDYVYTTVAANGCDSIVTLHLTINNSEVAVPEYATICHGETYTWNGQTYSTEGEYSVTLSNTLGCDSVATLHLTIMPEAVTTTETVVIGSDELPYVWRGNTYSVTGRYTDIEQYATIACDSIIHVLDLTVLTTGNHDEQSVTICETEAPYTWYSESYTATGKYTYTEKYVGTDIDSIQHILNLTVNPTVYTEEIITACDSYTWNGETYTQSGDYVYTTTAANGCDSIVTLHLTINNSEIGETEYVTICYGETYTWNGQTYSTKGEYSVTLQNAFGCDSVATLHLTIMPEAITSTETVVIGSDELPYVWRGNTYSATGRYTDVEHYATIACDSVIHVLDLTVLTTGNHDEQSVTICETEAPYQWYGESYSATGKYTYTEKYVGTDIDSVQHILNLTVNPTVYTEEHITACDSYTWNGEIYTESGDYVYTTVASNGCDSIVTLHLTINQTKHAEESITACDSYTWNGETYTTSGDYVYTTTTTTTTTANGCDSIVTLHLTINQTKHAEESITACDSYTWNGETYTESGEYVYTTTADNGCDSIVTLHLTINQTQYAEVSVVACDSYTWNGQTYTQSGDYIYTTTAANGCDSIVTLHLTINQTQYAEVTATACDSYTWNGETYTESGEYVYTTTAANGCDSIITLRLTINQTKHTEETAVACDSYTWNGDTYTESGDYTYTTTASNGCDSIVTLHLTINNSEVAALEYATICYGETYTWNGQTYSTEGEYSVTLQNAFGCDSVATLHLTIMPAAITTTEIVVVGSDELPYTWRGNTYTATGRYTDIEQYATIACDSAIHVLDLTVLTTGNHDEQSVTICETEAPYLWYGESYSATGKYTYTEKYAGTDIDSIQHILNLTVNPTVYTEEIITACDSYTWNGETYTTSGDYVYTTVAANGCDSIITLLLTINQTKHTEETAVACDSYTWNGEIYTQSGEYTYTTVAANGCDSIVTLHLTINNSEIGETEYVTICHGETYTWNGQTYSTEGEYSVTLSNTLGCDSVATLQLTIMPEAVTTTETVVIGSDELPYTWRGNTYSATGRYTVVEQYTTVACDSAIYVLDLTVLNTDNYDEQSVTICETEAPYTWYGESYSATGKYTYTEKYVGTDIDSIQHILNLTVNPTVYTEEIITACDSYTWNGQTYTESGDYVYTTVAANGCDSIVTLHLTINNSEVAVPEYATICHGETYTWNGQTYSTEGEYSVTLSNTLGCDSVATLHLTIMPEAITSTETVVIGSDELPYVWRGNTYSVTGRYTDIEQYATIACDSAIHVLDLTVLTTGNYDEQSVTICETEAPYLWYGELYSATGKYTYTEKYVGTDIDSIQHILNLTVNPTKYAEESITACDSYTWNGETYTESGDYVYTTTAANGCDSIVTLHLTINQTQYAEKSVTACDSYEWNGETYTQSGDYVYTTTAANGCDSIVTLHLTINQTQYAEVTATACDSYTWNGETYTESGEYVYTTTAANGCDSIVTLHLTINNSEIGETEYVTICHGETYTWNGQTYSTEGEYSVTLQNAFGCDSIATLHLTIMPAAITTTEIVVVGSDELPYVWRGNTYSVTGRYTDIEQYATIACDSVIHVLDLTVLNTDNYDEQSVTICETETPYQWYGESYSATGKYTYTEKYVGTDIDSIQHILNLTVNPTVYTEETITACDSYTWNGETYTESGDYVYTTVAANGCDSIVTLHLTINQTKHAEESITACDSYTWNGETYTQSGDYIYTTTAANGCDSIVTLHLTINHSEVAVPEYATICHGETYTWNGQTYSTEGEYSVTLQNAFGCDSIATLHLTIMPAAITTTEIVVVGSDELPYTWRGNTYSATGRYTDIEQYTTVACDSAIHVLDLTVLNTDNYDEQSVTICETEAPYLWYGESYSATGKYTYTEKYVGTDIDSIQHILNLTVNPTKYAEESITACDSYTWNGETYTESGDYVYTTTAANGCDSIVTLHLTINQTQYAEKSVTACDSYEWNGENYTESGDYVYTTTAANGCDRVEVLHLTILEAITETEILALCPSELPYEWYGQSLTEAGLYTATEQYSGMSCDSIIHELTLNIFVQTLPEQLTLPIVQPGKPIDVTIPTEEILAYIAAQTWYAPNAWVVWYVKDGAEWGPLTTEPVSSAASNVVLKYAVETDCDIIESTAMTIIIEPTSVDLIQSVEKSTHKIICNDKVWIIRNGEMYNIVGVKVTEVR